jgi:DNA-binding NarL/FixJ family response regulator
MVDDRPLHRASLRQFLENWADQEGFILDVVEIGSSLEQLGSAGGIGFAILCFHGAPTGTSGLPEAVECLRLRVGDAPIIVLSERGGADEVGAALKAGARGFITTGIDPDVMRSALTFIIRGGVFFPPDALLGLGDAGRGGRRGSGSDGSASLPCQAAATALTRRQKEILRLLRLGKSNKEIARELRIAESTVKIHVSHLMRKLGVSNRTQAALRAPESGEFGVGRRGPDGPHEG